jgi:hypothetical protein
MNTMKDVLKSLQGKPISVKVDLAAGVITIQLKAPNAPESYDSITSVGDDVFLVNHHRTGSNKGYYLSIAAVLQVEAN